MPRAAVREWSIRSSRSLANGKLATVWLPDEVRHSVLFALALVPTETLGTAAQDGQTLCNVRMLFPLSGPSLVADIVRKFPSWCINTFRHVSKMYHWCALKAVRREFSMT